METFTIKTEDFKFKVDGKLVRSIPLLRQLIDMNESNEPEIIPVQMSAYTFIFIKEFFDRSLKGLSGKRKSEEKFNFPEIKKILANEEIRYFLDIFSLEKHREFYKESSLDRANYIYFDNYDHTGPLKISKPRKYKNDNKNRIYYIKHINEKPYEVIRPDVIEKKLELLGGNPKVNYVRGMKSLTELINAADFFMMQDLLELLCIFVGFLIFDLSVKQRNLLLRDNLSSSAKRKIIELLTDEIPYFPDKFYSKGIKLGSVINFAACEKLLIHAFDSKKIKTDRLLEEATRDGRYDFLIYAKSKMVNFKKDLIYIACEKGDFPCLRYLYVACNAESHALSCMPSVVGGNINCFKFMLDKNFKTSLSSACNFCIGNGKVKFLMHAVEKGCVFSRDDMRVAITRNALDCLKYIAKVYRNPAHSFMIEMVDAAVYFGSFECLKYLIEELFYPYNAFLIKKNAIRQSKFKCLKYIHEELHIDFDDEDLLESIRGRNLMVMKFIMEKVNFEREKFILEAIDFQNIEFLKVCQSIDEYHVNRAFTNDKINALKAFAERKYFPEEHLIWESLEYRELIGYMRIFLENGYKLSERILRALILTGHVDLLKLSGISPEKMAVLSAKCGSVKCLKHVRLSNPNVKIDKKKLLDVSRNGCKWYIRSHF